LSNNVSGLRILEGIVGDDVSNIWKNLTIRLSNDIYGIVHKVACSGRNRGGNRPNSILVDDPANGLVGVKLGRSGAVQRQEVLIF